jgi:hypothetical protein
MTPELELLGWRRLVPHPQDERLPVEVFPREDFKTSPPVELDPRLEEVRRQLEAAGHDTSGGWGFSTQDLRSFGGSVRKIPPALPRETPLTTVGHAGREVGQ